MAATYNDGAVQYGSVALVVRQNDGTTQRGSAAYVFDNLTVNRPTKAVDRTNELGEPSGSVGIPDFVTGSAQVQIASATTQELRNGDRILCDETGEAIANGNNRPLDWTGTAGTSTAEKFFITSVSRAMTKDGEVKLNISFKKQYGA